VSALGDARFRRLLIGNSISSFGDSALYLSLGIWAKDLTGSNAAAGAIFLAEGLPCLAAPLAGQLVDRVRRRPLLIAVNAAAGTVVAALLIVHSRADLWVMYAVATFYGAASTIIGPAGSGLTRDLLADDNLIGANAASVTISQGLRVASPLAGAGIYASLGGGFLAVLDSATFLAAIAALLSVNVTETRPRITAVTPVRAQLLAGAAHIRRTPLLAQITLSATIAMLVLGFYESVTFAVIAAIGRPTSFFGVLMSIQAVGSIIGGLTVGPLIRRAGEARTLGLALAAWAVASLVYTIPALPASCAALAIFGVAVPLETVVVSTATQRYSPPHLQGRVFAASFMAADLAQMVSIAIGACLVDTVGYEPLLITAAVVVSIAAIPALARPAGPPAMPAQAAEMHAGLSVAEQPCHISRGRRVLHAYGTKLGKGDRHGHTPRLQQQRDPAEVREAAQLGGGSRTAGEPAARDREPGVDPGQPDQRLCGLRRHAHQGRRTGRGDLGATQPGGSVARREGLHRRRTGRARGN
jgi:MFS family permease